MSLAIRLAATLVAAFTLAACPGGQNPARRDSNPVRNLPNVEKSIEEKDKVVPYGTKLEVKPEPDNNQYTCTAPFIITTNSPTGFVLKFSEESAATYEITFANKLNDEFEAIAKDLQAIAPGAVFRRLRVNSASSAVYQIAWTPKNMIPVNETSVSPTLDIELKSEQLTKKCQGAVARQPLTLLINKGSEVPVLNMEGLPQTTLEYRKSARFTVDVTDRTANASNPPNTPSFAFNPQFKSGETLVLDGSRAVNCSPEAAMVVPGKWRFTCQFDTQALATEAASLIDTNKMADAVFMITVRSRNGKESIPRKVSIKVRFSVPTVMAMAELQGNTL